MRIFTRSSLALCGALAACILAPAARAGDDPTYNRDIRPILAENCFACHGPDAAARKAGLRLDQRDAAVNKGAIIPGDTDKSELVHRIFWDVPSKVMPPPRTKKTLTDKQKDLLKRWIAGGAEYQPHWAFIAPVRAEPPAVQDEKWVRNPIDQFILARLEREGLHPSAEADRETLIRRLSLDLTGLPPTPAEVDAFVADQTPDAYEKLVDRLLAEDACGEHWARMWLDLARYGDSAGYANDPPRTIWLYRDYVIRSFNENKPFDQFTIEQIAGDLLPHPTDEQLIATAFHRNTMTNSEGGTSPEEFRNAAIIDRVNTTMTVWMGASIACCQCHDHKYDPLTNKEYFQLFAIFNNTDDANRADETPMLTVYTDEQKTKRAKLETDIAAVEAKFQAKRPELAAGQAAWERDLAGPVEWTVLTPDQLESASGATLTKQADGAVLASGTSPPMDTYTITVKSDLKHITGVRLEALTDASLPSKGPGRAGNFVLSAFQLQADKAEQHFKSASADFEQQGFPVSAAIAGKGGDAGWAVSPQQGKDHTAVFVLDRPIDSHAPATLTFTLDHSSKYSQHILGKFRLSATSAKNPLGGIKPPDDVRAALAVALEKRSDAQRNLIANYYAHEVAPELAAERTQLAVLKKQLGEIVAVTVPIMRELPAGQRRKSHIEIRGNYLALGDEVSEGVPAVFPPLDPNTPHDRLALARWLVDPRNPLTARVLANRLWEQIFGIGIVRTSEEFGSQGELPEHPELLDWLATEMVRQKWDVKKFLKLLVTSATYRQSSRVTPDLRERDPDNRLLARGPRFRLSAEMVRDQALAVSGLLSRKMYGPSVKPPRPSSGLSAAFGGGLDWQTSAGEDRYRRALYTEWRRSSPYPSMSTFDAPNREVCTVRRLRTNTPLQALVTLNDPVYVEAAQALARRMAAVVPRSGDRATTATAADKARFGFRLCVARSPRDAEVERLVKLYDDAHAEYARDKDKAVQLATNPLGPVPAGMDPVDLAAWTTVANVLLNLDETLMKR
ncbi:MAG TPA: PSD1 and planctomycete cytochrome C domain-containing protein [Gemmataceae bacterium]|nr:PSD1 and planctomycete cytochrome C domain-containing protein [Gemmataceae bacterium]